MYEYYPNEKRMIDLLDYFWEEYDRFYITGRSGCGKSFTLKKYLTNNHKEYLLLYFAGDYLHNDIDYYPFLSGLSSANNKNYEVPIKEGMIEFSKDLPYISNLSHYIVQNLMENNQELWLNQTEEEILSKIQFLQKKYNLVIFFDDLHWWDKRSVQLLDIIINKIHSIESQNKMKLFFSVTPNQESVNKKYLETLFHKITCKYLKFPLLEFEEFKKLLEKYVVSYDEVVDKKLRILFQLINSHMKVLSEVLKELEKGKNILDFNNINGKDYLNELLEQRLKELGATGKLISKVLEYASIIGLTFSYYELEKITRIKSQEFKIIIMEATELELIQNTTEKDIATFAHQIVRELFEGRVKTGNQEFTYYSTIEQCLAKIKPAEYLRRARYLVKAGNLEKATLLYLLDFLQQLRNYGEISEEIKNEAKPLLDEELQWYLNHMQLAYDYHDQKKYDQALDSLELIEEFYPPFLVAEKRLLQSFCYTKSLDKEMRSKSLECIENFNTLESVNEEVDIYERIQNRLMSVYAHLGMIKESSKAEYLLMQNLRFRYQYDENARIRLNIIRRTYNIVHDCKTSEVFMKKAIDYFAPKDENSIPTSLKHYYIALVNYSSILTINGKFEMGYEYLGKAMNLENDFKSFPFPRRQILYNNFVINSFLNNKLSIKKCIDALENLINELPVIAERLTYTSNLSVFIALNGETEKAINVLLNEVRTQNVEHDIEGFYKFRSYTNLAIFYYLSGDKYTSIKYLNEVEDIIPHLNNSVYYQEHHNIIVTCVNENVKISPFEWWNCVHTRKPDFKSPAWNFFGIGYILASLSNWDTEN